MGTQAFMSTLLSICGGITVFIGTCGAIYGVYKWMRKPSTDNTEKIEKHEKDIADLKVHVESDYQSIKEIKKLQSSMGLALVRIMDHLLYGDHNTELEKAKDDLWELLAKSK